MAKATTEGGFLLADRIQEKRQKRLGADLRAAYQDTMVTWKSEAAAIDGQIVGYFAKTSDTDKDALIVALRAYDRMVENYLGYCLLFRQRSDRYLAGFKGKLREMQEQTGGEPTGEASRVPEEVESYVSGADLSGKEEEAFREAAQNEWAQRIRNASAPLITMVRDRQPNGLEVGAKAFIRQVIPFN